MKITKLILPIALMFAATATTQAQDVSKIKELLQQAQSEIELLEAMPKAKAQPVTAVSNGNGTIALDTLPTENDAVKVVLFNDNSWRYIRIRSAEDWEVDTYAKHWDTIKLFPYEDVQLADLPQSVVINLVDSLKGYHYPIKGTVRSKFGPRGRRRHRGVDIPLKTGDPIYATFSGKVRISTYNKGGYGNLVIIRHDNGLETWHGHLDQRFVKPNDTVYAGQIIGLGGDTGRSTGPHLHYEMRYFGQTFDPERLVNFENGNLRRETFLLKKDYFDIHSRAGIQDFEDEILGDEEIAEQKKKEEAAKQVYHKIRSGDTLGGLAVKYGTTVSSICRLNGITTKTTLRIGRSLRVR